jgi:hypothetical protein
MSRTCVVDKNYENSDNDITSLINLVRILYTSFNWVWI